MKQNDKLDRELTVNTDEDVESIVDSLSRTEIAELSVCMTACLPGRMDGWTDGRMDEWTDRQEDGRKVKNAVGWCAWCGSKLMAKSSLQTRLL